MFLVPPAAGGMAEHVLSLLRVLEVRRFDRSARCACGALSVAPAIDDSAIPSEVEGRRFRISLVCDSRGTLASRARLLGIPTYTLPISSLLNPVKLLWLLLRLAVLFRIEKPRIIHAHSWSAGLLAALTLRLHRKRPAFICTLHSFPPEKAIFTSRAVNMIADAADRIICVSNAIRNVLSPAQQEKAVVIPNGVEMPEALLSREDARDRLGLSQGIPIVGTVARLAPQKGVEVLIEAAAQMDDAHFAVIGDGPLMPHLQARCKDLGIEKRFHLLGHIGDIKRLLHAFDIIAIPSISEGSSLVAMEAMTAGRVIVASRLPALEEIVVDGENGLLVPPGEPEAFACAAQNLLKEPDTMRRMGTTGQARVLENFTIQLMLDRTMNLYEDIIVCQQESNP